VALTRMMCDENLMMQERHITAAIDATRAVEMHEGVPVLVDEDGRPVLEMAFSGSV
jgi:heat shock protein HslJ